jgi:hypothetical protein
VNPKDKTVLITIIKQVINDYNEQHDIDPEDWNKCSDTKNILDVGPVFHAVRYYQKIVFRPDRPGEIKHGWNLAQFHENSQECFSGPNHVQDETGLSAFHKAVIKNRKAVEKKGGPK